METIEIGATEKADVAMLKEYQFCLSKCQDPIGQMRRLFNAMFPEEPDLTPAEAVEMVDDNNAVLDRAVRRRKRNAK